ncbi:MAG: DUF309 domain-containing protein [Chloroflexi bacterium]|nr:DUF309 domain-containing protein [Chloroflexota bacterium]
MTEALPRYANKGQRRKLEAQWLAALENGVYHPASIQPQGAAPPQLFDAVRLFNAGLYWECHEVLEEVWLDTPYPQRFFWSALIKLAVGMHHAARRNTHGARVKIGDAVRLLPLFQPNFAGVDTAAALSDALRLQQALRAQPIDWSAIANMCQPVIIVQLQCEG